MLALEFPKVLSFLVNEPALYKSGIYQILNLVTGLFYIGSAFNFTRRWNKHIRHLNKNIHSNNYLQNAWNKYGEKAFRFSILEIVDDKTMLKKTEQNWLNWTKCYDRSIGYNICRIADTRFGIKHSNETKAKMSAAKKGIVKSKEWQDKINTALRGKERSEETKRKLSIVNTGKIISNETRKSMSEGQKGRKHSEESKLKRSLALKGRKILNPRKGHKHSEQTLLKMSIARKNYLENLQCLV